MFIKKLSTGWQGREFRISDIESEFDIARRSVNNLLNEAVNQGYLIKKGAGRSTYYALEIAKAHPCSASKDHEEA